MSESIYFTHPDAACLGEDVELFFPRNNRHGEEGKAICRRCPVKRDCLEFALARNERYGIYGGMTDHQRRKYMREHGIKAPRRQEIVA